MSKSSPKKGSNTERDRRKKSRPAKRGKKRASETASHAVTGESCSHCATDLRNKERALFVEEEVGRVFCSEDCITLFFTPDIERLEKEYRKHRVSGDLSGADLEKFAHLRWITLQESDEIWREKTLAGDYRFTLISEFKPADKAVWSVCICLFLRGEPSFLYLAFTTRNEAMANHYRKGERVQRASIQASQGKLTQLTRTAEAEADPSQPTYPTDGLAEPWTEAETLRAQLMHERKADDIPLEEYELYQTCMDETLESPEEIWTLAVADQDNRRIFHFIRYYPEEKPRGVWFVIVARETETDEEIEILDAFPTHDQQLVECYRKGEQELGRQETRATSRVVH